MLPTSVFLGIIFLRSLQKIQDLVVSKFLDTNGSTWPIRLIQCDFGFTYVRTMMKKTKQKIVLNKGTEKFIFRYERGCEDELLDAFIEQVKNKRTDFDWFDAAVLSFKLTQSLIGEADKLLKETDKH